MFGSYRNKALKIAAAALVLAPVTAVPQSVSDTQIVPVSYFGRVTYDGGVDIIQPDGSTTRYTGPVPALGASPGDVVRFQYDAEVPVGLAGNVSEYSGQKSVDGLYDISFYSPEMTDGAGTGKSGVNPDAIKMPGGGGYGGGSGGDGQTVSFKSSTGEVTPVGNTVQDTQPVEDIVQAVSDETVPGAKEPEAPLSASSTKVAGETLKEPVETGGENWSDAKPPEGGVNTVPEPGSILLLGAAGAILMRRRRRARRG